MKNSTKRVGIICDLGYERHPLFKSYYYALQALFDDVRIIKDKQELLNIDLLVVGDDHYAEHKQVLQQQGFIGCCNALDLPVLVLTIEKTLNSYFPWNEDNLKALSKIKHLYHYMADVDDCVALGTKVHKISISKKYENVFDVEQKKDAVVFIGSTECKQNSYKNRKSLLTEAQKVIDVDIIEPNFTFWEEYMETMAQYRFVLSPLGNGNILALRFYEILCVGAIPIQQVKANTLSYYDVESRFEDCIFFKGVSEIKEKIENCKLQKSYNRVWTENHLELILKKEGLW